MEIIWSPQSLQDLEEIGDFIAQDSSSRAYTFIDELILSAEKLKKFPESDPLVEESPIFRQIVYQKYRLIYKVDSQSIMIITVLGPGKNF